MVAVGQLPSNSIEASVRRMMTIIIITTEGQRPLAIMFDGDRFGNTHSIIDYWENLTDILLLHSVSSTPANHGIHLCRGPLTKLATER